MNFSDYLQELEDIFSKHGAPWTILDGCERSAMMEAERLLGFAIHPDLRGAWHLANGSAPGTRLFMRPGFLTGYEFLSLAGGLGERDGMRQRAPNYAGYVEGRPRDSRIRTGWFAEGWLPFADFGGGTLLLIQDHTPSQTGRCGQIIAYTHDPDEISYVAPSFPDLLRSSLDSIKDAPEEFLELF